MNTTLCTITMSDNGKMNGHEHFWKCGRKAVASVMAIEGRTLFLCPMHLKAYNKKAETAKKRFGIERNKPVEIA